MNELALARFVRPRVIDHREGSTEPVRIEDALGRRLAQSSSGRVFLHGPPGAGKRTALEYARLFFEGRPDLVFGSDLPADDEPRSRLRVCIEAPGERTMPVERLELVPWRRDEWIEYLLARHRGVCARVMARLEAPETELELKGRPVVWAAILDELARDPALPNAFEALRAAVRDSFSGPGAYSKAGEQCWIALSHALDQERASQELRALALEEPLAAPLLNQTCVHLLLGAEHVAETLARASACELPRSLPDTFLRAIRPLFPARSGAQRTLALLMGRTEAAGQAEPAAAVAPGAHASAASLLHLFGSEAVPAVLREFAERGATLPRLSGAQLDGLSAPGANLREADLAQACLARAQLDAADLGQARLDRADLRGSSLRAAKLAGASARAAVFDGADLRAASLDEANLRGAQLRDARLEGAQLAKAELEGAQLCRALLDHANLAGANLRAANLSDASLIGTNLSRAILDAIDLRVARIETRLLSGASLVGCNLESVRLEGADLSIADLRNALLSGSHMPGVDLRGAQLGGASLARVEWPGAILREADLTDASFQSGSSRSGMVMAAPAEWGTRTGFYNEELRETSFKRAQIRKADLRRADLRGARIFDTDFYLVDLRGALYTSDQAQHLRACGAIL
jgi:uncharacterized protein YjbI with pentapeptide repeats